MINIQKSESGSTPDVTIKGSGSEIVTELATLLNLVEEDKDLKVAWELAHMFLKMKKEAKA